MIYNRYGWSLSLILYVVLFIPPKRTSWPDYCLVFTLLMLLFYTKITYFAVGMAALGVAIVLPGSIASNRRRWIAVFLILALFPVAPFNRPYLTDIVTAALAGGVRTRVWGLADSFLADPTEYAFAISGCVLLAVLASLPQLQVSWANPMFGLFIVTSSAALLSQNAQTQGIPTYQVIALLLYRLLRDLLTAGRLAPAGQLSSLLLAPLVFPVVAILASGLGLAHYSYTLFVKSDHLVAAQVGNLRGLAVQQ